jgi:anti-sigma-K factor RskA
MDSHELHTLTGAYAVDALEPSERAEFERHLRDCASCRLEVAELSATAARLAEAAGAPLPEGLRDRVLSEVASVRQLSPLPAVVGHPADLDVRRHSWFRQPLTAAAAALLVVAVGLGGLAAVTQRRADEAETTAAQIAAVAADPDHVQRTVELSSGGTGTVLAADGIAVFHAERLPGLPRGQAYQLWRISGQESHSAGVLGRGGALTGVVKGVGPGDLIGVTIEPSTGSAAPTTDPIFLVSAA